MTLNRLLISAAATLGAAFFTTLATAQVLGLPSVSGSVVTALDVREDAHVRDVGGWSPFVLATDGYGRVYVLNNSTATIAVFDLATGSALGTLPSDGRSVRSVAWSDAHQRLYVGYGSGEIRYFESDDLAADVAFAELPESVDGLAPVGNYLLAQDESGAWNTHYIFNSAGAQTDAEEWNRYSRVYTWVPQLERVYFFRDQTSPNDIHYEQIDQLTGQIVDDGESPYHGSYAIVPPIRASHDGALLLLGSGDIYDSASLERIGSFPDTLADARWTPNGDMVGIREAFGGTLLERRDVQGRLLEVQEMNGLPLALVENGGTYTVITVGDSLTMLPYTPNDDSDGDGVPNTEDSFPLDVAASLDSDGDGYPDAWNEGYGQSDSTTGLTLDAYPDDSACFLPEHGDGVNCDPAATLPDYTPDAVAFDRDGIVYLLSNENRSIYRWDAQTERYINPVIVGSGGFLDSTAPVVMTYVPSHHRVYLGYDDGTVSYFDPDQPIETTLSTLPGEVSALTAAGNFLVALDGRDYYVLDAAGALLDTKLYVYFSRSFHWNGTLGRLFHFRDGISPNDLLYTEIDQVTGQIGVTTDSPYHGDFPITPPLIGSADGTRVMLGGGDVYDAQTLQWVRGLPLEFEAGVWLDNGGTLLLRDGDGGSVLERRDTTYALVESRTFDGAASAVLKSQDTVVVVTQQAKPVFALYVANDDSDGDGVANTEDAFPNDPAASVDSDGDGYPDVWNDGMGPDDSTMGLVLDAYPNDSACQLPEQGVDGVCDIAANLPAYASDRVVVDDAGVVYTLSTATQRVYRWDSVTRAHLNPIIVGRSASGGSIGPTRIDYSFAHARLYLGYDDGAVTYVDTLGATDERLFAASSYAVGGLAAVGDHVLVQDASGAWVSHSIYDRDGEQTHWEEWNYFSEHYAWNASLGRIYFFGSGSLRYEDLDANGVIIAEGGSSDGSGGASQGRIIVSPDDTRVMLVNGDTYDAATMERLGSLSTVFTDGEGTLDGGSVVLRAVGDDAQLERRDPNGVILEVASYSGEPVAVRRIDEGFVVVTQSDQPHYFVYQPNDDSDGDGVPNTLDAFPLDPAASVDSDGDGYPDAWNSGFTEDDSTTGLVLDAFPHDTACWLPDHGTGGVCDVGSTLPDFSPDTTVMDRSGIIYMLSAVNNRVYRWYAKTGQYLNPYVVGSDAAFDMSAPNVMAYSSDHNRLYFGYDSGNITYIDVRNGSGEQDFATVPESVRGIASAGRFVLAQDATGFWDSHHIFDRDGVLLDSRDVNEYSRVYEWNATLNRMYYFRDGSSPNDLMYEDIDPVTGEIVANGESPYHGSYQIRPPIRSSLDGAKVMLGSGDIYDASSLTWLGSLGVEFEDGIWLGDGATLILRDLDGATQVQRRDAQGLILETIDYPGTPVAIVRTNNTFVVVTQQAQPGFYLYEPTDDSDGDGVLNLEDDFPLDPAASLDSDGDGFPDAWNDGYTADDSTTGLELDAFPNDSACWFTEHGSGGVCDISSTLPDYMPERTEIDRAGIVYLLSSQNNRVYRWYAKTGAHLNPLAVGVSSFLETRSPQVMTLSHAHRRLYFGYDDGAMTYIDLTDPAFDEMPFANASLSVDGLASVGDFVLAQDDAGAWESHHIYDRDGVLRDSVEWNQYSRVYEWNEVLDRVYFFRDTSSPNDLMYEDIDQLTGQIVADGESPYHGDYTISPPIRVSPDGSKVLIGSGDIYDAQSLVWLGSLGNQFVDAVWLPGGGTMVMRDAAGQTQLERRDANGVLLETVSLAGQAHALRAAGNTYVAVTITGNPQFSVIEPDDDSDGDGVPNTQDAFPLDPAASVDSDGDGFPDAWNDGFTADDSTSGLELDAFPNDSACWLAEHGSDGVCDISSTLPAYLPERVAVDEAGIVYLFSPANYRVYRWSVPTQSHLNPFSIGSTSFLGASAPAEMVYSAAHGRLYFGYDDGVITFIDLDNPGAGEQPFAITALAVRGLASVGNFVLAQDDSGAWESHHIYDVDGNLRDSEEWNHYSRVYAWNDVLDRVYFFRDGSSPNDLMYEDIDPVTGEILADGDSPYHGAYSIMPPIRVAQDGSKVLLGSGDIYDAQSLTWLGNLAGPLTDAVWMADGGTAIVRELQGQTRLERRDENGVVLETAVYDAPPLAIRAAGDALLVIAHDVRPVFYLYTPNDDADGDGVPNTQDAFPTDPAASVDSDGDGYPDAWNPGMSEDDSTTGLVLDVYPNDSACYLPEHGDGITCDISSTLPAYLPDSIAGGADGVVYLLSAQDNRVFRWDSVTQTHLNPIIVGSTAFLDQSAPSHMAYSQAHNRLYFAYASGQLTYIDLATEFEEVNFASTALTPRNIAAVGDFLLAEDPSGAWNTHYIFDRDGQLTDSKDWNRHSVSYAWNEPLSRVYFFRNGTSPNDLHFEEIDQITGLITDDGETPYHGTYQMAGPIRVNLDGSRVIIGSGNVFDTQSLEWQSVLPEGYVDARWAEDDTVYTLRASGINSTVSRVTLSGETLDEQSVAQPPLGLLRSAAGLTVVTGGTGSGPYFQVLTQ